ncbi:WbqC family protein [bacterium]|nr:WbqC family protein [bacterium]
MIYSVHQPHYIPYPGYLAKVARSEQFVFLEGVQFVKREWQNRNRVKGPDGLAWLTVPVKGEYRSRIDEMLVDNSANWRHKHLETLKRFYSKAPFVEELEGFAQAIEQPCNTLAELAMRTTGHMLDRFAISTPRRTMASFGDLPDDPNERIIEIGKTLGADVYLAGEGGRNYMDLDKFSQAGIEVEFYCPPAVEYPQLHGEFVPNLGSLDMLLMTGPDGFSNLFGPKLRQVEG